MIDREIVKIMKIMNDLGVRGRGIGCWDSGKIISFEEIAKALLDAIELCPNPLCQKGKALSKDGSSSVEKCPICMGRGFKVKENK